MTADATTPVRLGESEWAVWSTAMVRGAGFPAGAVARLADEELAALADRAGTAWGDEIGRAHRDAYHNAYRDTAERVGAELGAVARSSGFRLAVGWQNRRFLDTAVEPFLRQLDSGTPANARRRAREQAVAMYWQRYCLKNESIGFFGPTAWASVGTDDSDITARPGPELTDRASVYLERWPVDALAARLAAEFDLTPWYRPRRNPLLRIDGDTVRLAGGPPSAVDPPALALLRAADGTRTAADIARRLSDGTADGADAVLARLGELRRRRWVIWRMELSASLTAEEELRGLVGAIDDERVRSAALSPVQRLIDGRDALRRVWDRPAELAAELSRLEATFVELTGVSGTRNDGQAYGGRTLAYLECRRDVAVHFGASFTDRLQPLVPVLASIRWLTWHIRHEIEPHLRAAHAAVRDRAAPGVPVDPDAPVDVAAFWMEAMKAVGGRLPGIVADALAEFHRRWAEALPHDDGETGVHYTGDHLAIRVKELFDTPSSGWNQARMSCPDVMVAAESPQDAAAGRYTVVLGEIHAAMNSLDYVSMVPSHRHPETLAANLDATFPEPRLLPVLPTESRPRFTVRSHPALIRDRDHRLALVPHTPLPRGGTVVPAADAVVRERDGRLRVVAPDGTEFDVFDLFAEAMKALLLRHFDLFPIREHRPRVTVDDMVVTREGWRLPVADLGFADLPDAPGRFAAARAWARDHGLPRHVFVKSPVETKPFYVDLASPVLVEILASSARRALRGAEEGTTPTFTVVEMLPGPHQAWLTDAAGERYTCEFRFAAYDLHPVTP